MFLHELQHLAVRSDYDLILLRQAIRQQARSVGLVAPRQARFTAAVSEYARLLLREETSAVFIIGVATRGGGRQALEVMCAADAVRGEEAVHTRSASSALSSARALVDDAQVEDTNGRPCLVMRMWLAK